jgi:hypothetical protein
MSTVKTLPLTTLVEDFSLYPRNRVDDTHISDLVRALQAGAELPPIIADAATKRIVDGFHRRRAYLRVLGPEAAAKVELRRYRNEAALFLEAVDLNAHHGRKLDRHDQSRIVLRLRELQVDDRTIALTLHVPEQQVQTLSVRVVYEASTGTPQPIKRGLEHMKGQTVTADQMTVIDSVRSADVGRLALELTRLLDAQLADLHDNTTVVRLQALSTSIAAALHAVAA